MELMEFSYHVEVAQAQSLLQVQQAQKIKVSPGQDWRQNTFLLIVQGSVDIVQNP